MPITLIMDNSHYQRCELVTLKADALDIELLFLPAYSPTSTSSRGFGSWSKRPLTKRYYDGFDNFRHAIDTCLEISTAPAKSELTSLLIHTFQLFKIPQFT